MAEPVAARIRGGGRFAVVNEPHHRIPTAKFALLSSFLAVGWCCLLGLASPPLTTATAADGGGAAVAGDEPPAPIGLLLWDGEWMKTIRRQHHDGSLPESLGPALDRLAEDAAEAMEQPLVSVLDKQRVPPSGDKRDYYSLGIYWWPDPGKEDGLPYIRRDGERNPEADEFDRPQLARMAGAVETLTLSWFLSGNEEHGRRAIEHLRHWFLDSESAMRPHLEYAQAIPGRTEGRGIGLIETNALLPVPDCILLLQAGGLLPGAEFEALRGWFADYQHWFLTSSHGRDEARERNNHGTWYDVQASVFSLFVGQPEAAREILGRVAERRLEPQVNAEGAQPHELRRTLTFTYSVMNLDGFMRLAHLAERFEIPLWDHHGPDGELQSIRGALEFLHPYADPETASEWRHPQIAAVPHARLWSLLHRAAVVWPDGGYRETLDRLPDENLLPQRFRLLHREAGE